MEKAVIDMSQDTLFVLEQVQGFLEWLINEKKDSEVITRAEELIELIHIKEEIILHSGQQEALTIIAKEQCKIAAEVDSSSCRTETERYFIEAAQANYKVLSNKRYLEILRKKEFEEIVGVLQRRQQEMEAEGEKEVCS